MMLLWVIYFNPKDHPNKYVARLWNFNTPTPNHHVADNYDDIISKIPTDLIRIDRMDGDDPCIVEVWL